MGASLQYTLWKRTACLIAIACFGPTAWADQEQVVAGGPPMRPFFVELRYTPSETFRADFKDAPGRVTVQHHDVSGTLMIPLSRRSRFNVTLSRDRHAYRFRDNDLLAGTLEEVHETSVGAAYMGPLNEDWSIFGMGRIRWAAERGASRSDGRMQSGMFMFQREWLDGVILGVGAMAASRLDEDPLVIPTASIDWQITERWRFRTMRGVHLFYQLDEAGKWEAGLNSEYHSRYVRMHRNGIAPDGVFRSRLIASTLSLAYRPNPGVTLGAEAGFIPWRKITIRDGDGDTVFQSKTDAGYSAAFTARMLF